MKKILKNLTALLVFFASGISASVASVDYFADALKFWDAESLPENPVGIVVVPFLGGILTIFAVLLCAALLFALGKEVKWQLLFFRKGERAAGVIIRCLGCFALLYVFYGLLRDLIASGALLWSVLWYHLSFVAFFAVGIVIAESLINN